MDFETRAIHEGQEPDPATGAVTVPIYQTSTYVQEAVGEHKGYDYSRTANPDAPRAGDLPRVARERRVRLRILVGHGRDDDDHAPRLARRPDRRRQRRLRRHLPPVRRRSTGRRATSSRSRSHDGVAAAIDERTRLVWLETPTNPLLNIVDIRAVAEAAHAAGAVVCVDNTFATPYLQRPLELGADIVHHSTTKYLGGHSDLVGGFAGDERPDGRRAARVPPELARRGARAVRLVARAARPEDARAADANATARTPPPSPSSSSTGRTSSRCSTPACPTTRVTRSPPGRCPTSAGWSRSSRRASEDATALVARTKIWKLAESLGGVESLIEVPAAMTHASTADSALRLPRRTSSASRSGSSRSTTSSPTSKRRSSARPRRRRPCIRSRSWPSPT